MKKFWNNGWVLTIVGGTLATLLAEYLKNGIVLTILKTVSTALLAFLTFQVSLWIVLVAIFCLYFVFYLISKLSTEKPNGNPWFVSYKEDTFKLKWRWDWEYNHLSMKWEIENLRAYCSDCGTQLAYYKGRYSDDSANCPKCKAQYGFGMYKPFDNMRDVLLMIHDKCEKIEDGMNNKT